MKYLGYMNGWKTAPHCWWRFLLLPLSFESNEVFKSLGLFGFVIFWE